MSDQSTAVETQPARNAGEVNGAEVTLNWMLGLFLIGGVIAIIAGLVMNAPNEYAPNEINMAGVPLIILGSSAVSLGVMAFFSLLIVNAVRWQPAASEAPGLTSPGSALQG